MLFSSVFVAIFLQTGAAADPLEPARAGMLQCYAPVLASKGCAALASYTPNGSGFANRAEVRLSTGTPPLITMTTTTQVHLDHGKVCGRVEQADLDAAEFRLDGADMPQESRVQIVKAVVSVYANAGIFGHEVCTTYVPAGDMLSAQIQVDGVPRPELTQPVRWVKADEGFAVR